MTLVHIVLLGFKPEVSQEHKDVFVRHVKSYKNMSFIKGGRPIFGGPSATAEFSKNFEYAFISYHEDLAELRKYQASDDHHQITSKHMYGYESALVSFDLEVDPDDKALLSPDVLLSSPVKVSGNGFPVKTALQESTASAREAL